MSVDGNRCKELQKKDLLINKLKLKNKKLRKKVKLLKNLKHSRFGILL